MPQATRPGYRRHGSKFTEARGASRSLGSSRCGSTCHGRMFEQAQDPRQDIPNRVLADLQELELRRSHRERVALRQHVHLIRGEEVAGEELTVFEQPLALKPLLSQYRRVEHVRVDHHVACEVRELPVVRIL